MDDNNLIDSERGGGGPVVVMEPNSSITSGLMEETPADGADSIPESSLEKDNVSVACSPAPSNSSLLSEQEGNSMSRQSPFLGLAYNQASPSSSFSGAFQRPDFLNISMPDSETSSRSSLDGSFAKDGDKDDKFKLDGSRRSRKISSGSSSSDDSELAGFGELMDGEEPSSRKHSKSKILDEASVSSSRSIDAPRGRIANIRRESNCSLDNEVAHERLVKVGGQVSSTFDEISLEASKPVLTQPEPRVRTNSVSSVGEPITIVTNAFLPHSCSPSPTRLPDTHKQCYSPSTQQIVRANIPYSPIPSPTQSPTRQRFIRSQSPIQANRTLKRRYTSSEDGSDPKRGFIRNSTSPLVTDRTFPYPAPSFSLSQQEFAQPTIVTPQTSGSLPPLPTISNSLYRRLAIPDSDSGRASSVDSFSDDQKSIRDDISEPSSVLMQEQDAEPEGMDTGDSDVPSTSEFSSSNHEDVLQKPDGSLDAGLPGDTICSSISQADYDLACQADIPDDTDDL